MRRFIYCVMAVLLLVTNRTLVSAEPGFTAPGKEVCTGDYGTRVTFEKTPNDAARAAKKQEKLVMILHISGHFEDPNLT